MNLLTSILNHALSWMVKLTIVLIMLTIYQLFAQPYIDPIKKLGLYIANQSIYKIMPYSALLLLDQVFILVVTFSIFLWIVGRSHHPENAQTTNPS